MTKLTAAMSDLLAKVPDDWGPLPGTVSCTNMTLVALERRGKIETRVKPGQGPHAFGFALWQWRRAAL